MESCCRQVNPFIWKALRDFTGITQSLAFHYIHRLEEHEVYSVIDLRTMKQH